MEKTGKTTVKNLPNFSRLKLIVWLIPFYNDFLNSSAKFIFKYGDLIHLKFSNYYNILLVNHPEHVKHVLKNDETYSRKRVLGSLSDLLGNGLFGSEGPLWEQQHKLIKPALHEKMMANYMHIIERETQILIDEWNTKSNEATPVDIEYDTNVLMLKILLKTQFCDAKDVDYHSIIVNLRIFLKEKNPQKVYSTQFKNQVYRLLRLKQSKNKSAQIALDNLERIIQNIRNTANKNEHSKGLLLNILDNAQSDGILSETQVVDEIKNFIFAGFDTTASVLTWSLYSFAKEKQVAVDLKNNLLNGDNEYLKKYFQEVMRLYPPVYSLVRVCRNDDNLNGFLIKKGKWVGINVYALHRNPKFWENPEAFDPNRFSSENMKGKAFLYIPFGQGRRACIGKPLAMAELQTIFPKLVEQFDFELTDNSTPKISPDTIIKSKNKLMLRVNKKVE